jgi:hypothetical protein
MKKSQFAEPIKVLIKENPAFSYRTVAHLSASNKNTVQHIFQLKGWEVKKRPIGFRPPVKALPLMAKPRTNVGQLSFAESGPAPVALGQGQDGGVGAGAGSDSLLPHVGTRGEAVSAAEQ